MEATVTLRSIFSTVFAFASATLITGAAPAQPVVNACGPFAQVSQQLEQRYDEVPTGLGLVENRLIMQLYSSTESGTWTIVMTNLQGVSCVVASGHSWELIDPVLTGPGA
jgi:hypothetical protein